MSSHLLRKFKQKEDGTTLVLLAVFIVALFAFAALSIDVSNVFHHQRNEQAATDAGAFSAILLLTNSPPATVADLITEAQVITVANGVTTNEITASNYGTIQVGHWDGTNFANGAMPRNAVLVPAKRLVPLVFGKVIGMNAMNPATHSIGALEGVGCVTNVIPFGVTIDQLAGKGFNDSMTLNDAAIGTGKQGKINILSVNGSPGYGNTGEWDRDMLALGCGGDCLTCVGTYPVITGNAHVAQDFNAIAGDIFTMPIVDQIDTTGNKPATIIGFVKVVLTSSGGTGKNWTAEVKFLSEIQSGPGGGHCDAPCLQTRTMVE